jgi:hypothetical protein
LNVPSAVMQRISFSAFCGDASLINKAVVLPAVAPHAYPAGSGAAICQLFGSSSSADSSSDDPVTAQTAQQSQQQQQQHNADQQQLLPEITQLLSTNQQLLVTFLVDTRQQQQQQEQHATAGATATYQHAAQQHDTAVTPALQQQPKQANFTGSSSSACSRWMHPGLQQYLYELERGPWTSAAAAHRQQQQQQLTAHPVAALACTEGDRPAAPAATAAGTGNSSANGARGLLAWLAAAHPAAVHSVDGKVAQRQQQQQQTETSACSSSSGNSINSVAEFLSAAGGSGCSMHPNIQPVLLLATSSTPSSSSSSCCAMVAPHCRTDLQSLLRYSPSSLGGDWHLRFLLHQLLHALAALHAQGLALGGFSAEQLLLQHPGWLALLAKPAGTLLLEAGNAADHAAEGRGQYNADTSSFRQLQAWQQRQQMFVVKEPWYSLQQLTEMWRLRSLSNLEYLMWLNAAAGRVWGDRKRHPLVPWVIDFSTRPDLSGVHFQCFFVYIQLCRACWC